MKKKEPIEMNSMQKGLQSLAVPRPMFAPGGTVGDPLMDQSLMTPGGAIPAAAPQAAPSPIANPMVNGNFQTPAGPAADLPPDAMEPDPDETGTPTDGIDHSDDNTTTIHNIMAALGKTPPTNPNIYQGISADDRLKLQQALMSKMNSGGNLAMNVLGGLGDAVSNSFGGKNTSFQKGIIENQQKQSDNTLAGVDTARAQRLQDVQGNQEAALADPKSPLSQSMRKTLQSAGLNVPSGMSGEIMLKVAGPLGELAMKQATLGIQQASLNNTAANQQSERVLQAVKDKSDMGIVGTVKDKLLNGGQMGKALDAEISDGRKGSAPAQSPATNQPMQTKSGIKYTVN